MAPSCWSRTCKPGCSTQKPCMHVPTITLRGGAPEVVLTLTSDPAAGAGAPLTAANPPIPVKNSLLRILGVLIKSARVQNEANSSESALRCSGVESAKLQNEANSAWAPNQRRFNASNRSQSVTRLRPVRALNQRLAAPDSATVIVPGYVYLCQPLELAESAIQRGVTTRLSRPSGS